MSSLADEPRLWGRRVVGAEDAEIHPMYSAHTGLSETSHESHVCSSVNSSCGFVIPYLSLRTKLSWYLYQQSALADLTSGRMPFSVFNTDPMCCAWLYHSSWCTRWQAPFAHVEHGPFWAGRVYSVPLLLWLEGRYLASMKYSRETLSEQNSNRPRVLLNKNSYRMCLFHKCFITGLK